MKLKDFHIFEKFRKIMETTIGQLHAANSKDFALVSEIQDEIEKLTTHTVTPEVYNQIKAVFDRLLKLTFCEPEREYADYDYFELFGGFSYRPIVPYTTDYVARIEKDDFFELSRYKPPVEEMIKHLKDFIKPETVRFFESRLKDCEYFMAKKREEAVALREKKYRFWEKAKKKEDEIYAHALESCATNSQPFADELETLINTHLLGNQKDSLCYQARSVVEKYQLSGQDFKKLKPERQVVVAGLQEEIRRIYSEVSERSGWGIDVNKVNLTVRDSFKRYEIAESKKREIATLAISQEEIDALKNDNLFIHAFYDAVANKGELQGTESDRFVVEFLVEVLQKKIEEVLSAEGKTVAEEFKGVQKD